MAKSSEDSKRFPLDEDVEILRRYEAEKKVGSGEEEIELLGCKVSVPANARMNEIPLNLRIDVLKRIEYRINDHMLFGPQLHLGPDGTEFSKPVAVSLPTCYSSADGEKLEVEVQTRGKLSKQWEKCEMGVISERGNIEFELNHFSPYRFLMRMLGVRKGIAHMSFIRQNEENDEYEMIWCFCDNLRETRLDVEKSMTLQEFNLTKAVETFTISCTDNLTVSIEIDGCEIENSVQMIQWDDIWFSDSIVQKEFVIRNLEDGKKINYRVSLPRGETKENSFVYKRGTGQMNPGQTVNIVDPRIGTVNF